MVQAGPRGVPSTMRDLALRHCTVTARRGSVPGMDTPTRALPVVPSRGVRIAAVHALPTWLAAHPDVDTPDTVRATRLIGERHHRDPAERIAAVRQFAAAHDVSVGEGPLWVWAIVTLGVPGRHGLSVDYALFASKANERVLPCPPPGPGPAGC